ncbi:hypothetical protein TL16_g05585 [Triparma laevis f. inornata]|uniref:Sulfatase N-terminal domain-containing protein n=1 Tax=Triparma laevis f. inornata TaxID=1714386 RepID=A0A9W7AEC0_9STRA|nr:hypothetical protein TL16_g05585 [Triparma laevis f. inornata]
MIIGKTHFSPLPPVDYKNIHTGNDDMRCSDYKNESCLYLNEDQFLETYLTNDMIKQVGNHVANSSETPFFVHLSFVSPHPPSTPPHPWNEFYSDDDISSLDLNYEVGDIDKLPNKTKMLLGITEENPAVNSRASAWLNDDGSPNMEKINQDRKLYYDLCAYVDSQIGRAVDFIDSLGIASETLIIFTSDHGSQLYDHGIDNDKHTFLDASWRVPLIMRQPGAVPAGGVERFASTLDVTTTILAAAGVIISEDEGITWDAANSTSYFMSGFDMYTPLVEKGIGNQPRLAVPGTEYRGYAVVTGKYKLAYYTEQDETFLWDRVNDVQERENLAKDEKYSEVINVLRTALLRWRAQQDDLQWQMEGWKNAAEVGIRARDDAAKLTGLKAEINLQNAGVLADSIEIGV